MAIDDLRQLELSAVCQLLGLMPDAADRKQFKAEGFRICVNGFKWFDHDAGKGGGGAIDLTMHIMRLSFTGACAYLAGVSHDLPAATHTTTITTRPCTTKPPTPNSNNSPVVLAYLTNKRGLNIGLVQWCLLNGLVYADSRRNCVFRYGSTGAELRGTGAVQWRSVYGTIEHGFILPARDAVGVAVLESSIDALSYRPLHRDIIAVSIAGNGNHKVIDQVVGIAKTKSLPLISAFDNDSGGAVADNLLNHYAAMAGVSVKQDRPLKKDWNEVLTSMG